MDDPAATAGQPDDPPDTSDDAVVTRELEDQESIAAALRTRRQALLTQLN